MIRRPPRSTRTDTLFPYTTLFRSLDDGTALFDSRVICEYLDGLHDRARLFPAAGPERLRQLRWQALADGLTDILLLWRNERLRRNGPEPVLLAVFETKVRACFAAIDRKSTRLNSSH